MLKGGRGREEGMSEKGNTVRGGGRKGRKVGGEQGREEGEGIRKEGG